VADAARFRHEHPRLGIAVFDQLVVLGFQKRKLGDAAIAIQDAQLGVLVADDGRALGALLDPDAGPGCQLVGDLVDECVGARHETIVSAPHPAVRMDPMSDESIADRIERLVGEEHRLRDREQVDAKHADQLEDDQRRLQEVEIELDRCWDLLRQRRALRESGGDPNQAQVRDADTVERYWQ